MARNIELQNTFSGPLDLLLYLVRRDEIDIHDIPISHVTKEYLNEVNRMPEIDVDAGGEFLAMASMLTEIKGRMLLPEIKAEDEDDDEIYDPRQGLVEALLEYKKFKEVAAELEKMSDQFSERYTRNVEIPQFKAIAKDKAEQLGALDLLAAFQRIARRMLNENAPREIVSEEVPTEVRIQQIEEVVVQRKRASFTSILSDSPTEDEMVGFFIAILELIRLNKIVAQQSVDFSEIYFIDYAEYHNELNSQQKIEPNKESEEKHKIKEEEYFSASDTVSMKYLSLSPQRISNIFSSRRKNTRTIGMKRQILRLATMLSSNNLAGVSIKGKKKAPVFPALIQQHKKLLPAQVLLAQSKTPVALTTKTMPHEQQKCSKSEPEIEKQSMKISTLKLADMFMLKTKKQYPAIKLREYSNFLTLKRGFQHNLVINVKNLFPLFPQLLPSKLRSTISSDKKVLTTPVMTIKENLGIKQQTNDTPESTFVTEAQKTINHNRAPQPLKLANAFTCNPKIDTNKTTPIRRNFLSITKNETKNKDTNYFNNSFALFPALLAKQTNKSPSLKNNINTIKQDVTPQATVIAMKATAKPSASSRTPKHLKLANVFTCNIKLDTNKTAQTRRNFLSISNKTFKINNTKIMNKRITLFSTFPAKRTYKSPASAAETVKKKTIAIPQPVTIASNTENTPLSSQRPVLKLSPLFSKHGSNVNIKHKSNITTTNNFGLFKCKPTMSETLCGTLKNKLQFFAIVCCGKSNRIEATQVIKPLSCINVACKNEDLVATVDLPSVHNTQLQLSLPFRFNPKTSILLKPTARTNNFDLFAKNRIAHVKKVAKNNPFTLFTQAKNYKVRTKVVTFTPDEISAKTIVDITPDKKKTTANTDCGQISNINLQLSSLFNFNPKATNKQRPTATVKSFVFFTDTKPVTPQNKMTPKTQKRITLF